MGRVIAFILALIFLLSSNIVSNTSAQSVLPDIEIDCMPDSQIRVYPGATNSGYFYCTLSNPTSWSEEVEITIESGILISAGPGTVTIGAGADLDFQVSLRGEEGMAVQTISVVTTAVVVSANGQDVSSLPEASDTAESLATILEYSAPTIQLTQAEISMVSGETYDFEVIFGNNGNGVSDTMTVGVSESSWDTLQTAGFSISSPVTELEIGSGSTETVQFQIRAPKDVKGEESFVVEFFTQSQFSCRYELAGCNWRSIVATVFVSEAEPESGIAAFGENSVIVYSSIGGGIIVLGVAIVVLRKKKEQGFYRDQDEYDDEFDDEFDDDYDDDFDDGLDDDFFDDL